MTIDLDYLLDPTTEIKTEYRDEVWIHTMRMPNAREWMEYQRRSGDIRYTKKRVSISEDAASVTIWLYDLLTSKCEVQDGNERVDVENFKDRLPVIVKHHAAGRFVMQVQAVEEEDRKNSDRSSEDC